jgi:preprotein translocase subunit SecD
MGRRWVRIVLGVALVLAMGACDSSGSESTTTRRSGPRASLQMRPVLMNAVHGAVSGPGQTVLEPARPNGVDYVVGPVALSERDVDAAKAFDQPSQGWAVHLTLTSDGTRKLNRLAQQLYPKQPPQNSVAIVVDGKVQSAPVFTEPSYEGGRVEMFVEGMTAPQAKAMAASLRP